MVILVIVIYKMEDLAKQVLNVEIVELLIQHVVLGMQLMDIHVNAM
jgi:hypothetical protein